MLGRMDDKYARYAHEVGARLTGQPLQLEKRAHLGASQAALFAYLTDIEKIAEWIPVAKRSWADDSNAEAPSQVGSVRVISTGVGTPTRETILAYEAPRMLAYSASDKSLFGMYTDHLSVITCEPHEDGGTVMTWLAFAKPGRPPMRWLGPAVFAAALGGGMRNLKKRFPR